MATPVILPKQGNSVESCLIVKWNKNPGDSVQQGEPIAEVETDKALFVIESPASGILLDQFFRIGDEVPVKTNIAAVGEPGEDFSDLLPAGFQSQAPLQEIPPLEPEPEPKPLPSFDPEPIPESFQQREPEPLPPPEPQPEPEPETPVQTMRTRHRIPQFIAPPFLNDDRPTISPRAQRLAEQNGINITRLHGTGPEGMVIERDVRAVLNDRPAMTRLAKAAMRQGGMSAPEHGQGIARRVTADDLRPAAVGGTPSMASTNTTPEIDAEIAEIIPIRGIRKLIAQRMYESLQSTAQLTLNTTADARALRGVRRQFKASDERQLQVVSINDLLLFVVAQVLVGFPALNAILTEDNITRYSGVNLGFAVDTPRGLLVPVIKHAHMHPLTELAQETKRLAKAINDGKALPTDLQGGTFTVTNLGSLGIESFTPIINPPQVAILGIGGINLKPVEVNGDVQFIPHLHLSLTIDHQAVDGAPAARFLQALTDEIAHIDRLLEETGV